MIFHVSLLVSVGAASAMQESHLGTCLDGDLQCYAADASYISDNAQPNYDVQLLQREVAHTKHVDMNWLHSLREEKNILKEMPPEDGSSAAASTSAAAASAHSDDHATVAARFKIPFVLHWTGKQHSLRELGQRFKNNLMDIIEANPLFRFKYWDDDACFNYIQQYYTEELAQIWQNSSRGPYGGAYRGDICRTVVLFREGGFYMDLDVQLSVPLMHLIDYDTTFMNVLDSNALFASAPHSSILQRAVENISPWYRKYDAGQYEMGENTYSLWLGPSILGEALKLECGCTPLGSREPLPGSCPQEDQWKCGHHEIRLYEEVAVSCSNVSAECPRDRQAGVERLGVEGSRHLLWAYKALNGETLGWPRFATCENMGCGGTGHRYWPHA